MPLIVICKIFRLFVKTLTPDDRFFLDKIQNLSQPVQMQLSKKQKDFLNFLLHFWNQNLNNLKKMPTHIADLFPKLLIPKDLFRPMPKKLPLHYTIRQSFC